MTMHLHDWLLIGGLVTSVLLALALGRAMKRAEVDEGEDT